MSRPPRRRFGITAKFTVLATLIALSTTAVWGSWVWQRERGLLEDQLRQKGHILLSAMAIPFINALLYEEMGIVEEGGLLDNFIAEIMGQREVSAVYAMVLDPGGVVLAHNDFSEYHLVYQDPLSRSTLGVSEFTVTPTRVGGEPVWDLAYPLAVHGRHWGVLRVGLSLEPLNAALAQLEGQVALFAAGYTVLGMGLFILIGTRLARPLMQLREHMEAVGDDLPEPGEPSAREDEIGVLERGFAAMLERLQRSEAERRAAVDRLIEDERLVAVGETVAGVAHEVNNPLAAMEGAVYRLEQRAGAEDERYVRIIKDGLERISRVMGQLLDLSRSGELQLTQVELPEFCRDTALFAKVTVKKQGARFISSSKVPALRVGMDRIKVHQLLLNLIANAADAAGPGGTVRLECDADDATVRFMVCDDGPGVPDEIAGQIFDPFFTTKPAGHGSGMGLSVSRRIAENHGGSLTLEPSAQGACFALVLPLRTNAAVVVG
ncbi:MAG TPA: ATP-binding protein [Deferrisomatales bacterium]|nr:ATP-binding protein [Deferrisomatales bacterium]